MGRSGDVDSLVDKDKGRKIFWPYKCAKRVDELVGKSRKARRHWIRDLHLSESPVGAFIESMLTVDYTIGDSYRRQTSDREQR